MLGLFRKPKTDQVHRRQLEAALHDWLGAEDDTLVRISEVSCGAYGCADAVTAVLIMRPGRKTVAYRVDQPLEWVALNDLVEVVGPSLDHPDLSLAEAANAHPGSSAPGSVARPFLAIDDTRR